MASWRRRLDQWSRVAWLVRTLGAMKVMAPFAIATWAAVEAITEGLPKAEVIAFTALSFAGTLLCVTQLRVLLGLPQIVRPYENLEYALAYSRVVLGVDPANPAGTIQVKLELRNSGHEAIRFKVERFHVVVGNTTLTQKTMLNDGSLIPYLGSRTYADAPFPSHLVATLLGKVQEGELEADIAYGRPDEEPSRRYKLKLKLTVLVQPPFGIADGIVSESEEPIY